MKYLSLGYIITLISCTAPSVEKASLGYFDTDSLFTSVIGGMSGDYDFKKTVTLEGQEEEKNLSMSVEQLQKELGLLSKINPNKPVYKNVWDIEKDGNTVVYTSKQPDKTELKSLQITFAGKRITQLNALVGDENSVFTTNRMFTIQFDQLGFRSYKIEGEETKHVLSENSNFQAELLRVSD